MSEWKETSIGSLCTIKHGFAYKGEYITNEECSNVLVTPGNFTLSGGFKMMDKPKYYKGPVEKEYILKEGDLIVTMTDLSKGIDTLGYSALVPKINGITFHHNQRIGLIENISEEVDKGFLYWTMRTRPYQRFVANSSSGTTVHHTSPNNISRYSFLLPPLAEQKNIASILFSLDSKIAVNRRICENLEAQAQALFKHWFIDFVPFKNGQFVESELGMIPEGWRVGKFTDIFDLGSGGTPKTSEKLYWEDGSIPFFSPKDVNGVYCFDTEKHITEKGLNNCSSSLYSKNTVFITCRGTVGKVAMAAVPMAMNQSNYAILSNKGYSQYFAYLMTVSIVKKLKFKANGAVFDAITSKDFKEQIIIPNLNVVNRFDSIIQPIFDNILNIGFENLRLSALRDTLLPKLMSGQIKVNEVEKSL